MNLIKLAEANGLSLSTAKRYKKSGIDLTDRTEVEAHQRNIRTRRGLSKFRHRAKATDPAVNVATRNLETAVEDLESRICGIHSELEFLVKSHPDLTAELSDAFAYCEPILARIASEE